MASFYGENPKQYDYVHHLPHLGIHRLSHGKMCLRTASSPHSHAMLQCLWILEGNMTFHVAGQKQRLRAGWVALMPPGVVHFDESNASTPSVELVDMRIAGSMADFVDTHASGLFVKVGKRPLVARARELHKICSSKEASPALIAAEVWRFLNLLSKASLIGAKARLSSDEALPVGDPRIGFVATVIRTHARAFTVPGLARVARLSASQLNRLFKKEHGTTASKYHKELRLSRARNLLRDSNLSIAEIGAECGFGGSVQFVRAFKAKEGIPPGAFRKKCRGGI